MTLSAEIIRTTHLPELGGVYFGLKNQYKIVFNTLKKITMVVTTNNYIVKSTIIILYYIFLVDIAIKNSYPLREIVVPL